MPTSRLSTFVIDCKTDDLEGAAAFWSKALRRGVNAQPAVPDEKYRDLACAPSEPIVMVQKVEHESRIHLDIESDDVDAEVARLEGLGARKIERIRTWVVMEAPTGQRFCVVRQQRPAKDPAFPSATPQHEKMLALAGHYTGKTTTWFDPATPVDEADEELHVTPILGGRWLRLELLGKVQGKVHSGEMLLGYHADAKQYELAWVDSFHTAGSIMMFTGPAREDGVIAVTGSYGPKEEPWGWRTEISVGTGGGIVTRSFNIMPGGKEFPALHTAWARVGGEAAV